MRVIIAGSRHYHNYEVVERAIVDSKFNITEIVWGGAPGVDQLGFDWGIKNGVTIKKFEADWEKYGKAAGPIRNTEMVGYGQALLLIWDGFSPGSRDIKKKAMMRKLPIYERIIDLGGPHDERN